MTTAKLYSKVQIEQKITTLKTNGQIWRSTQGQNKRRCKVNRQGSQEGDGGVTKHRLIWLVQELFGEPNYVLGSLLCNAFQDPEMGNVAFKGVMPSPTLHKAFPSSPLICQFWNVRMQPQWVKLKVQSLGWGINSLKIETKIKIWNEIPYTHLYPYVDSFSDMLECSTLNVRK